MWLVSGVHMHSLYLSTRVANFIAWKYSDIIFQVFFPPVFTSGKWTMESLTNTKAVKIWKKNIAEEMALGFKLWHKNKGKLEEFARDFDSSALPSKWKHKKNHLRFS